MPFLTRKSWEVFYRPNAQFARVWAVLSGCLRRVVHLTKVFNYDFIFLHREALPFGPPIFEFIIAKILRKKIIYDFDDAIWLPDEGNESAITKLAKYKPKVRSIVKWSWKVSVGNAYLAEFASKYNSQVVINPTTIDTEGLHVPLPGAMGREGNRNVCIGWTGTHSTMKYLIPILPIVQSLCEKYDTSFLVISNKEPDFEFEGLQYIPWNKENEISDLQKIDIGIMPLEDDKWSSGKCGFKALQYMALEMPAVVSPVGVNTEIVEHGTNGFLCSNETEWNESLSLLIENKEKRIQMGKKGRDTVISKYSVLSNQENFLDLFRSN